MKPVASFVPLLVVLVACRTSPAAPPLRSSAIPVAPASETSESTSSMTATSDTATLANGCFWCTEAVFQQLNGVQSVKSGYTGGQQANPTYKDVCTGETGHAECLQIVFDPSVIGFAELLEVFFNTHDPTTVNRQGNDVGTQYRSGIFFHSPQQQQVAQDYIAQLNRSGIFADPIVTEITPFERFYPAESYHDNYFNENPNQGYCAYVIRPKVEKFRKQFAGKLKPGGASGN